MRKLRALPDAPILKSLGKIVVRQQFVASIKVPDGTKHVQEKGAFNGVKA